MKHALALFLLVTLGCSDSGSTTLTLPPFDPLAFGAVIDNPLYPLPPGTTFIYEGDTPEGLIRTVNEVTNNTKVILGVTCVEVHATEFLDGELIEETIEWFAQDLDGNVWYFGEDTSEIEGGVVVSKEGSWEAGVDGATAGVIMLGAPKKGDAYPQENAPGVAEDAAKVLATDESVSNALADYTGCLRTVEFTPLEPGTSEEKFYAPGVGEVLVIDDDDSRFELIEIQN